MKTRAIALVVLLIAGSAAGQFRRVDQGNPNSGGANAWPVTGSGTFTMTGNKSNNNAVPGANNLGVLGALANAADQVWTEGNMVLLSTTLAGYLRVTCNNCGGSTFADNSVFTGGTTTILNIGALYDTTPPIITDGNAGIPRMDSNRYLFTVFPSAQTVTANAGTGNFNAVGTLTNNNAAPGANNLGVLTARANAADPTWTEGNQTLLSSTLAGYLRVTCNNCGGSTFADNSAFTFGTTAISNVGFVLDDVAPNAATENSAAAARISSNRMQLFQLGDGAGNERRANVNASNQLTVSVDASVLPTGASTSANQSTEITSLQLIDDVVHADDAVRGKSALIGGVLDDVAPTAITENQGGFLRMSSRRALLIEGVASGTAIAVSGTVTTSPPSNASTNVAQFGGTNISTGTGAGGLGIPRVTISNDSSLAANQSVNVNQINSVTPLMGNGVTGTGSQRVTVASDNSAVSGFGVGATGAAPPANASYTGGLVSGATGGFLGGMPICDSVQAVNISSIATTLLITGVSGRHVRICAINLVTAGANNVALISGTGATCGTGTAGMNGGTTAASGWNFAANSGLTEGNGIGTIMRTIAAGDSVCAVTSAAVQLSGTISYVIY